MLKKHCYCIAVLLVGLLATACHDGAQSPATIDEDSDILLSGFVVDEAGEGIKSARINILGVGEVPIPTGEFSTSVVFARVYRLLFMAPGYYPMLHTFSDTDIRDFGGKLPAVTLVKKTPGRVLLAFAGDVMAARRFTTPASGGESIIRSDYRLEDCKNLLKHIKPYAGLADFMSVNLETSILDQEPPKKANKLQTFFSYPELLDALQWAGVDHVSLGNDHGYDYLEYGLEQTLIYLNEKHIAYSGAGLSEREALQAHKTFIDAIPYSFLSYVGWQGDFTAMHTADHVRKSGAAYGSQENITFGVTTQGDKRVSVVAFHDGAEYEEQPQARTKLALYSAIDAGADLAVGHHPQVLQGFELRNNKLIAYSLGNLLSDNDSYEAQHSALLYVWMDADRFHRAEIVPLYIKAYRPTPAVGKMRRAVLNHLQRLSIPHAVRLAVSGGHGVIKPPVRTHPVLDTAADTLPKITYPLKGSASVDGQENDSHARTESEHKRAEQVITATDSLAATSQQKGTKLKSNLSQPPQRMSAQNEQVQLNKAPVSHHLDAKGRLESGSKPVYNGWAQGDFEQHGKFDLSVSDWLFSSDESAVGRFAYVNSYGMKLVKPKGETKALATQQHFSYRWFKRLQAWRAMVYATDNIQLRLCVELREPLEQQMTQKCTAYMTVEAKQQQRFTRDIDIAISDVYQEGRVKIDVLGQIDREQQVYIDDLELIVAARTEHRGLPQ